MNALQHAARNRKHAKINRILSDICFVLTGAVICLAVVVLIAAGPSSSVLLILTSAVILASQAFGFRTTAAVRIATAQNWERAARFEPNDT